MLARGKLLYHLYGIFMSFVMFHQDLVIMGFVESGFTVGKVLVSKTVLVRMRERFVKPRVLY